MLFHWRKCCYGLRTYILPIMDGLTLKSSRGLMVKSTCNPKVVSSSLGPAGL